LFLNWNKFYLFVPKPEPRKCKIAASCASRADLSRNQRFPQSSSASRFAAGAFGFLTLTQCGERLLRRWRDRPSDHVEIKRFGANPTHVVGDLDCYSMPTSGKFGVFDEHTRRSWPCMCEYSSRDVYSQASISDTKGIDLNSCIGRGLKPYSDIDW
jgi:hypothetical protein